MIGRGQRHASWAQYSNTRPVRRSRSKASSGSRRRVPRAPAAVSGQRSRSRRSGRTRAADRPRPRPRWPGGGAWGSAGWPIARRRAASTERWAARRAPAVGEVLEQVGPGEHAGRAMASATTTAGWVWRSPMTWSTRARPGSRRAAGAITSSTARFSVSAPSRTIRSSSSRSRIEPTISPMLVSAPLAPRTTGICEMA